MIVLLIISANLVRLIVVNELYYELLHDEWLNHGGSFGLSTTGESLYAFSSSQ